MEIKLNKVGHRFHSEILFKNLDYSFISGKSYVILGHNGSGKSTLLRVISNYLTPTRGEVIYNDDTATPIPSEMLLHRISYVAPYIELIEELTSAELLTFYQKLNSSCRIDKATFFEDIQFSKKNINKQVKLFSSGMKQRMKLALLFHTESPIWLLDEPVSNLDEDWTEWYRQKVTASPDRLIIIASNDKREYDFCNHTLRISDYVS